MLRSVGKFLSHLAVDDPKRWDPLLAVYYLTYRCSFRCPYCSDGAQNPYYKLRSPVLGAERVLELLRVIRRHAEFLVITGGEPSQHPDLGEVLRLLPSVGFDSVVLTTNGHEIEPIVPLLVRNVTELVFSLDTLDRVQADACFGVGEGALERILANIERARTDPGRRCEIVVSSVVTPDNIPGLYAVYEYAQDRGFRFAVCPQLVGVKAHEALVENDDYRRLFDFVIGQKRAGGNIHGTVPYLEAMRDLRKFSCRPFTMLVVSPTGEVFYPCLELGQHAGNLLEEPDLHALRRLGEQKFGPQPECGNQCHSACALGFSMLLANPASALLEGYLTAKGAVRRRLHPSGPGNGIGGDGQ